VNQEVYDIFLLFIIAIASTSGHITCNNEETSFLPCCK